ncbi:MAG: hypothetical protein WA485_10880 [Candidatus Sulfotelmatobacter sp.]
MARATRILGSVGWWLLVPLAFSTTRTVAQEPEVVLHTSSNLVLVDVVAMKKGLPEKNLKREDFQLFDNNTPVPIKTFDTGTQSTSRPLALWLVVQCRMPGWEGQGSGYFAGQMNRFVPALKNLEKEDTVGVAHWCDNGDSQLDLQPTSHVGGLAAAVEQVLAAEPRPGNHDRTGELALQRTLQLIVDTTRSTKPEPLPVVIFLYGDWSGMPRSEADHFIGELLETSAVAFGLRDQRSPHIWWLPGEQRQVAHYVAAQTGGEYLDVTPETYGSGFEQILQQLHFRYELGFQPPLLDGKRHKLTVKLTDAVKEQYRNVRLRYRAAYVPVPLQSEVQNPH